MIKSEKMYILASSHIRHQKLFDLISRRDNETWFLVKSPIELIDLLKKVRTVEYIFFPHWSWKIPKAIYAEVPCVIFHMTDLPYGRGGSPLQNLIIRGHKTTQLTALKCIEELDAGPIYKKLPLSLEGSAADIFERADNLVGDLILSILTESIAPEPQTGDVVIFQRRTPEQSELSTEQSIPSIYDHIRMLDADGYPNAYLSYGDYILEFSQATMQHGELTAQVIFKEKK